jgi:CRISPR-associated protein Cas2
MRVVVSYDIADDKRRKKAADLLEMVLTRVQLSVFEGDLPPEVLAKSIARVLQHIEEETDSLRVYPLCAACAPRIDVYGRRLLTDSSPVRIL